MELQHRTLLINNINDREEILNTLSSIYTDEDFNGNNGEEYLWENAMDSGFQSNQEYVINTLKNSGLTGEELIISFFNEWLENDSYYSNYKYDSFEQDGKTIVTVIFTSGD